MFREVGRVGGKLKLLGKQPLVQPEQRGQRRKQPFHTACGQEIEVVQWSATPLFLFQCLLADPFHLDFHPTISTHHNPIYYNYNATILAGGEINICYHNK